MKKNLIEIDVFNVLKLFEDFKREEIYAKYYKFRSALLIIFFV
jgi:hypothetical protein